MSEHDEFDEHDGIDVDRVRERVKRQMNHPSHRPMWQMLMLIWLGIMVSSWFVTGFGGSMMRGRFSWGASPWVVFFLIILAVGWWQRNRSPSARSSNDDELDRAIRREIRRERQHMATGYWGDMPDAAFEQTDQFEQAEKRKRDETDEPRQAEQSERVMRLGDDGELIFDETPRVDDARVDETRSDDEAEQHHSATL